MKNFKQEKCKENRNNLRYLETNTFKEQPSITLGKVLAGKGFVKNKTEQHTSENSKLYYEIVISNKSGFISISISEDHLITAKITYKKTKEIKTRDMAEVVSLINEIMFT